MYDLIIMEKETQLKTLIKLNYDLNNRIRSLEANIREKDNMINQFIINKH